ncbi:LysR family transcriptional regulator [Calothrix sp. NIES-4071]|nr:LysR family transcriptional regulator [Calothrix sp. NIES-4071]BAZ55520.1 LysR family transcriptional regulator [Calothrix sp. NIES-4105]
MRQELMLDQATLYQLKIFYTVVKFGSFTRAGQELFLSQPAVCMQVKKLAQALGLTLFDKIGKNISPSLAGKELIATCDKIFNTMDQFEEKLADLQTLKQGKLRLSGLTTTKYIIPFTLGEFSQRYPNIDVSLNLANHCGIAERMVNNLDDLYIVSEIPKFVDVESYPFFQDELVVVASTSHPLAKEKKISINRLKDEAFIMREVGSATRNQVQNIFLEHDINVRVKMELNNNEMIQEFVADGLGISVLPRQSLISNPITQLTTLDVEYFPIRRQWYVVYPAKKYLSTLAKTYLQFLLEISRGCSDTEMSGCKLISNYTLHNYSYNQYIAA